MDTIDQYFDCLCRTCMNELVEATSYDGNTKPQQQWQSIFDRIEECGAFRIAELLTNAVPQIEVHSRDELPKRICCKCLQELLILYRFQQMCIQSQEQMRQQVYRKRSDLEIPMIEAAMEGEIETNNAGPYPLKTLKPSSTHQNLEHSSIQQSLLETTEQMVKSEAAKTSNDDIDQLLEDCRDVEGNLSEFVKNEPIEDDEPSIEYSDADTIQSIISVKDEVLAIESEEQQTNETDAKAYQIMHGEDKSYECPYCPRRFCTKQLMFQHKEIHEGVKGEACDILGDNVHRCELCPLAFPAMSELRIHFTTHQNEDPETRERNMKALKEAEAKLQQQFVKKAKKDANAYRIMHGVDKSHECPYCPRRFRTKQHMFQHKEIHEGFKGETCDICGKIISKRFLKQHKLAHSNEKPHKCDFCEKRFVQMSNLKCHIVKHTGEKPFKCKYCERSFSQSNQRMRHIRAHLGDNVHRCELCPLAFPLASELRIHLTTHKNEDSETRERNMKALKEAEAKLHQQFVKRAKE